MSFPFDDDDDYSNATGTPNINEHKDVVTMLSLDPYRHVYYRTPDGSFTHYYNNSTLIREAFFYASDLFNRQSSRLPLYAIISGYDVATRRATSSIIRILAEPFLRQPPHFRLPMEQDMLRRIAVLESEQYFERTCLMQPPMAGQSREVVISHASRRPSLESRKLAEAFPARLVFEIKVNDFTTQAAGEAQGITRDLATGWSRTEWASFTTLMSNYTERLSRLLLDVNVKVAKQDVYVCPFCFDYIAEGTGGGEHPFRDPYENGDPNNIEARRALDRVYKDDCPYDPLDVLYTLDLELQIPLVVFRYARDWKAHLARHHGAGSSGYASEDHRLRDYITRSFTHRINIKDTKRGNFEFAMNNQTYWRMGERYNVDRYNRVVEVAERASAEYEAYQKSNQTNDNGLSGADRTPVIIINNNYVDCLRRKEEAEDDMPPVEQPESADPVAPSPTVEDNFFLSSDGFRVVNTMRQVRHLVKDELHSLVALQGVPVEPEAAEEWNLKVKRLAGGNTKAANIKATITKKNPSKARKRALDDDEDDFFVDDDEEDFIVDDDEVDSEGETSNTPPRHRRKRGRESSSLSHSRSTSAENDGPVDNSNARQVREKNCEKALRVLQDLKLDKKRSKKRSPDKVSKKTQKSNEIRMSRQEEEDLLLLNDGKADLPVTIKNTQPADVDDDYILFNADIDKKADQGEEKKPTDTSIRNSSSSTTSTSTTTSSSASSVSTSSSSSFSSVSTSYSSRSSSSEDINEEERRRIRRWKKQIELRQLIRDIVAPPSCAEMTQYEKNRMNFLKEREDRVMRNKEKEHRAIQYVAEEYAGASSSRSTSSYHSPEPNASLANRASRHNQAISDFFKPRPYDRDGRRRR